MDDTELLDRLLAAALLAGHGQDTAARREELLARLANPEWGEGSRVHDWRNHVDEAVIEVWEHLPVLAQLVAFVGAEEAASAEEWD